MLLVEKGLAPTRTKAQALILAGKVFVAGQKVDKSGSLIATDCVVETKAGPKFVSRGGDKLEAAILHFKIAVADKVALDVGASTGGFTDCLLRHGAAKVYALDVGFGQLDPNIRNDPRVVVIERTNIRHANPTLFPEPIDIVTIDTSFISLTKVFPKIRELLTHAGGAEIIALIKPQFEVGPKIAKKGVVRDADQHQRVITTIEKAAADLGFIIKGVIPSPLIGPKGNKEFLILLQT